MTESGPNRIMKAPIAIKRTPLPLIDSGELDSMVEVYKRTPRPIRINPRITAVQQLCMKIDLINLILLFELLVVVFDGLMSIVDSDGDVIGCLQKKQFKDMVKNES